MWAQCKCASGTGSTDIFATSVFPVYYLVSSSNVIDLRSGECCCPIKLPAGAALLGDVAAPPIATSGAILVQSMTISQGGSISGTRTHQWSAYKRTLPRYALLVMCSVTFSATSGFGTVCNCVSFRCVLIGHCLYCRKLA